MHTSLKIERSQCFATSEEGSRSGVVRPSVRQRSWRDLAGGSPAQATGSDRPGSECCAVGSDARGEAYTAIVWGGTLSHEIAKPAEAETVEEVEGNMSGAARRGAAALPWSKTPSRPKGSRWKLGDLTSDRCRRTAPARVGKARSRSR